MYGLGTQDNKAFAERFLAETGVSHTLLWDAGFSSWSHFGFRSQPAAALVSPTGEILGKWSGIPLDEIAALL